MTLSSCTVSRYGTMSDYARICTDAAADEDGRRDWGGEEESSCNLQASGVELDEDAVAGWPRIGAVRRLKLGPLCS